MILAPTKELVEQIYQQFSLFFQTISLPSQGKLPHRLYCIYGGYSTQAQINALHQGVDILVSTPGRCIDLIQKQKLTLKKYAMIIIEYHIVLNIW